MRPASMIARLGILAVLGGPILSGSAQAQYGGYGGGYYTQPGGGLSVQVGVGAGAYAAATPTYGAYPAPAATYGGYPAAAPSYGGYPAATTYGGGYAPGYGGAGVGYATYPSPARQQGYQEGRLYYETGIAPNRPLSPAEARGFVSGERRAAVTPWQLDPARQQGYREGEVYWETGVAPNRPLSPAEAQGFRAGERRAATGYGYPY